MSFKDYDDKQLFSELYISTYSYLINYAYGIIHNAHDAEELVQEAYVRLANHFDKYKNNGKKELFGLLIVITRNLSINLLHKRERRGEVLVDYKEYADDSDIEAFRNILEEDMVHKCTIEEVRIAIRELKQGDRDVLILKYFHELGNDDIAEILSLNLKNVEVRLRRARHRMLEIMKKNGFER